MIKLSGEYFKTTLGKTYLIDDLKEDIKVGDIIAINETVVKIKGIVQPTRPGNKIGLIVE